MESWSHGERVVSRELASMPDFSHEVVMWQLQVQMSRKKMPRSFSILL